MMRILVAVVLISMLNTMAFADGIDFFHGSMKEALEKAEKENKKVFVDVYTSWCGPCKKMAKTVFVNKAVGDFYNEHFVNVKVDAEKGEGPSIAEKYSVSGYPTLLYLNPNGDVIKKICSSADIDFFLDLGRSVLSVNMDFATLKLKFEKNDITIDELYQYFILLKEKGSGNEISKVFDLYFIKAAKNKITPKLLNMISEHVLNSESLAFQHLLANRNEFNKAIGEKKVSQVIHDFYLNEFRYSRSYKTDKEFFEAKEILKSKISLSEKEELELNSDHYLSTRNEDAYIEVSEILVEKYYTQDSQNIGNILGSLEWVKMRKNLIKLAKWAKMAVELDDNFVNNSQMAFAYYSLNEEEKGDIYFSKAMELGKNPEFSGYVKRLEELKKHFLSK